MTMRTSKKRALSPSSDDNAMISSLKGHTRTSVSVNLSLSKFIQLMFTKQITLEPNQLPLTSEKVGLVNPPISDALQLSFKIKETLASLYSESTIAKIWGVAERALDKVSSWFRF
jgi:hypothetical protein